MKRMLLIIVCLGILLSGLTAFAAAPEYIPLQGVLTDAEGNAVEGTVSVQFALYDADDADTALWSEVQELTVTEGVFSAYLGMVQSFEDGMFTNNGNLWLGITVGSDEEMARVYLGSAPYARYAEHVGTVPDHVHDMEQITGAEAMVSGPQSCEDGYVATGIDDAGVLVCVEETDTLYDGTSFALSGNGCPDGEVLYGIDTNGLPLCRTDATNVYDGTNFALSGNACPVGEVLTGIDINGLPLCQVDETVEYDGTDFALSGNGCPDGEVLSGIDADGLPLCVADMSNTYTAAEGMGLELAEGAFGLMSTCEHGEVLKWDATEGAEGWICAPDDNVTYDGGNFALSGQACPPGQVMTGVDAAGIPTCAADSDTTYDGSTFALSAQACPVGEKVAGINPDGTVNCDVDIDNNTTYDGTNFALSGLGCPPGQMMTGVDNSGLPACAPDNDTTYSGGDFALSGLGCPPGQMMTGVDNSGIPACAPDNDTTYSGGDFALSGQGCGAGQKVVGINPDGTVNCDVDIDNNTTYDGTDFALSNQWCVPGTVAVGHNADGTISCIPDANTTYSAGTGLSLSGTTFAVNTATVQSRVTGTCPTGQAIRVINSNGTVTCQEASSGSSGGADVVYGDGSDGVLTISSPTTWNDSTEANMGKQYTDVNVNANWVVPSGTVIRCTGNFTVASGVYLTVSHGAPPADPNTYVILGGLALSPTTSGADPGLKLPKTMAAGMVNPGPLGGGAGSYGTGAFGGGGGGSFSVRCKGTITINGTLRSNGGNGGNGVQGNGAGGGAGGFIVLASQTRVHIPGQTQAIGGNGGNATQSSTGRARSGGSGGGGGVIYLLAPSIGSWNVLLNGGTPGTRASGDATTTDGEAGGSMGGTGGAGGVDAGPGNGGEPGYLIRKIMAHPENLFF